MIFWLGFSGVSFLENTSADIGLEYNFYNFEDAKKLFYMKLISMELSV